MTDGEFLEKIGERIVQIRKEKGIKQKELVQKLGMKDASIIRIEKGRVNSTICMLRRISEGLNVELSDLLQ